MLFVLQDPAVMPPPAGVDWKWSLVAAIAGIILIAVFWPRRKK